MTIKKYRVFIKYTQLQFMKVLIMAFTYINCKNNYRNCEFCLNKIILINKDLLMQRHAKINDKNRCFGVFMTPLSRRNKKL